MVWHEEERRSKRAVRLYHAADPDQRSEFRRDRDRILYSSHFRRLAGVTQIVRAGESDAFHTRLTHSMKVAQIGRSLAEIQIGSEAELCDQIGVDPDVVEAACLAHDLGHPPFGHVGEKRLQQLLNETAEKTDSFEGNAQSFRIVTKLAIRFEDTNGLDLTSATLAAILKYPWTRDPEDEDRTGKWGVYSSEAAEMAFAREFLPERLKSPEAELMDWADDIAYSVHDLEDFHRCRGIPWQLVASNHRGERDRLVKSAANRWHKRPENAEPLLSEALERLFEEVFELLPNFFAEPYDGGRNHRQQLRYFTSTLIGRYVGAISVRLPTPDNPRFVEIDPDMEHEVRILKEFTRLYVIENPSLAAQQRGHRRIIDELFADLLEDLEGSKGPKYFPQRSRHVLEEGASNPRAVADCIASLTETEALALHGRFQGYASGSVLDPILR